MVLLTTINHSKVLSDHSLSTHLRELLPLAPIHHALAFFVRLRLRHQQPCWRALGSADVSRADSSRRLVLVHTLRVFFVFLGKGGYIIVVVVVVFFTLTDRASTIPSNIRGCRSGTWSQRGTNVNGSHHGDNPLLRPTGIQITTKSYATLQAMAPTNIKTVHQTSFSPYREQPRSTRIVVAYPRPAFSATNRTNTSQPVFINSSKFLKTTHRTKIRKIEIPRSMVVEALSW